MNEIDDTMEDEDLFDEDTLKDRYLTFKIGIEEYGIEIKHIIEIIGIQKITVVPNIKNYVKGVINLRGNITPVIDIRKRFQLEPIDYNDRTCIIVVQLRTSSVGLIVDEVQEVMNIPEDKISPPPLTNKGSHSRYIQGIGKVGKQVKILLNINKILYDDDTKVELLDNE